MTDHRRRRRLVPAALLTMLVLSLQMGFAALARADGGDFMLDFIAAEPTTYDHATGMGGEYDARDIGTNVVESLEGGDFTCGDIVEFFTAVTVDEGATGTQSIDISYAFDAEPTGGGTVGYTDIVYAQVNPNDSGNVVSGNESASLTAEDTSGDPITGTVTVTGLEAGEVVIVAVGVELGCEEGDVVAHGNLHAQVTSAETSEGDAINVGEQDITMKNVEQVAPQAPVPGVSVTKECPSKVTAGGDITYTVTITNTGEEALENIQVTDSIFGDVSDLFADTLDVGESDTVTKSVPTTADQGGTTLTNTISVTADGVESGTTATATDSCSTVIEAVPVPTLPPTGFSGAGGLSAAWLFALAGLVLLTGAGLRYAARRRS